MPVAPNALLQAAPAAKPQAPVAVSPSVAAAPRDKGPGFAQVFANQASKPAAKPDASPAKPTRDKPVESPAKPVADSDKPAASTPAVADSGKPLPATPPAKSDDSASSDDDKPTDPALAQQPPADPVVDPALVATLTPVALPVPPETPAPVAAKPDKADKTQPAVAAPVAATDAAKPAFDPAADPLDDMPAVRLAMEQGGHVSASSQAPQKAAPTTATQDQPTAAQTFAAGIATLVDQQAAKDSTHQGGEKAFGALIDDGLKDLKNAGSDTRVDNFADRLAALTQAATPKTANALPPVANAPLAMHQSGWTEEVVNRVMYLSSASLKSAEIQLQPAELGRLDIKVNMTPDQQAQVTFMSGHAVVREALESQSGRLREMFAQQGMGQVDVNVSDQSRGQEQQQQQQNQMRGVSGGARGGRADSADHAEVTAATAPVTTSVIGSSAVDYYA
ncbi:flagellar hook-length control protein FliK [Pseudomonas poae]|uniref:Flagellar hook-length control protein FliK n=1 Tax=Pseudomonas poae TaxID=200451 RepID=A0ABY0S4A1_9PSED|nr:flagellar hook-length control protein FliK [Pseudomonas poae]KRP48518.1 flagellar hook-length control protein [Pseudomonas poae]SDO79041.1 flagellar hook-length control protein FliK [Pseudomonas poae]